MKDIDRLTETISHQLADRAGKTLLLTGPWGCGKTYLWHQHIHKRLQARSPVYVSLFGATSAAEVQRREHARDS